MSTPPPARFSYADLHDGDIRLPAIIGRGLTMPPVVYQSSRYPYARVLTPSSMVEPLPRHYFEFRIYRDQFGRATWKRARGLFGVRPAYDEDRRMYVPIAFLLVVECADRVRAATQRRWGDIFEGGVGEVADAIAGGDFEMSLMGGRAFHLQQLYVHPAFREQQLAARLLAHVTWLLATDPSDVVLLEAHPITCYYTGEAPVRTPERVERLVRYYERVGFRRWRPDAPITGGKVEMYYRAVDCLPFVTDAIDP